MEKLKNLFLWLWRKIKDSTSYLLILSSLKIMELYYFIREIVIHPIKNISIWLVGLLSYIIYRNIEIEFNGKNIFLMSTGLVSIMTFISNFLEKQTIDREDKNNFYLGYNIKKIKFYDNFWLKKFNELPVKLLFWIIAIIPIITLFSELKYKSGILDEISKIIIQNIKYTNSLWMATFILSSFYCTSLLIESVSLSSKNFSQSYFYKTTNELEKRKIRLYLKKNFKNIFNDILNFRIIFIDDTIFFNDVEGVTSYIIKNGKAVSINDSEIIEFYNIAFESEIDRIDILLKKVYKYGKCKKDGNENCFISNYLFKRIIELLRLYYQLKWNKLIKLDVLPLGIINIAIQDLRKLLEIEKELYQYKEYKDIFWGIHINNRSNLFSEDKMKSNLCISKICKILEEKFSDINFLNKLSDTDKILELLSILNFIDVEIKDNKYFSQIFRILFENIIYNGNEDINFVKIFYDRMKKNNLPEYLLTERGKVSKNILMSGDFIKNNNLEYLLNFIELEDIIVVLIFKLAYSERSGKTIMKNEEFNIWKKSVNKHRGRKDIDDLNSDNFLDKLIREIKNSKASHFLLREFIEWMWHSLFEQFNEEKYMEFIKLGENYKRRNFSLDSYIIVRLLLCNYPNISFSIDYYEEKNKNKMGDNLDSIKDILKNERIYL